MASNTGKKKSSKNGDDIRNYKREITMDQDIDSTSETPESEPDFKLAAGDELQQPNIDLGGADDETFQEPLMNQEQDMEDDIAGTICIDPQMSPDVDMFDDNAQTDAQELEAQAPDEESMFLPSGDSGVAQEDSNNDVPVQDTTSHTKPSEGSNSIRDRIFALMNKRKDVPQSDAPEPEAWTKTVPDENAWMLDEPEDDMDDGAFEEEYERAKAHYEEKTAQGGASLIDTLEFNRMERNFNARRHRAAEEMAQEMEEADMLYMSEPVQGNVDGSLAVDDDTMVASLLRARGKKRKAVEDQPSITPARDDDEDAALRESLEAFTGKKPAKRPRTQKAAEDNAAKPRGRAKGSKNTKNSIVTEPKEKGKRKAKGGKGKGKGKEKAPPKPKKPTKKELAEARKAGNLLNLNNILNNDIFRDVGTNEGIEELPGFVSTKKNEALKELLASLPTEIQSNAKTDKAQLLRATRSFGPNRCQATPENGQWAISGMKSYLTHYQMLGTSFMRDREIQEEEPRGGILADAMGLGKTVCMIANIVNGRQTAPRGTRQGPTLIVAAPSILIQWQDELLKHAKDGTLGHIMRYSGTIARSFPDPLAILATQGIILTTYTEVGKSYPKFNPPPDMTTVEEKAAWWDDHYDSHRGWLHRVDFHRVILDEAQAIKNPESRCSIGCRGLSAIHRWAISGTPVQNSLSEFYPYFKFLRVSFTGNATIFKSNFCTTSDPKGIERLNIVLSKFMIRRTHNDTLLGAKLLVLPKPSKRNMECHFREIEREIYMVVRTRFVLRINTMSKTNQLRQNYGNILVMLLRLRQLVGHPLLIQDTLRDLLEPQDFVKLRAICEKPMPPHSEDAAILQHLRKMLRNPKKLVVLEPVTSDSVVRDVKAVDGLVPDGPMTDRVQPAADTSIETAVNSGHYTTGIDGAADQAAGQTTEEQCTPVGASATQPRSERELASTSADPDGYERISWDPTNTTSHDDNTVHDDSTSTAEGPTKQVLGKAFGRRNNYKDYIQDLQEESTYINEKEPTVCCYCAKSPPIDPHVTSCEHVYCNECLLKNSFEAGASGQDHAVCKACGESYHGTKMQSYISTKTRQASPTRTGRNSSSRTNQGSQHEGSALEGDAKKKTKPPPTSLTRQVIDTWIDGEGHMLPSAKTLAVKAQVQNWSEEDPTAKILIYSQFMTMIRIISKICAIEGWGYCQFTGNSSAEQRAATIKTFETDPTTKIMIISLRCGGTGLNLTCASKVLIVDLWWNVAVEDQAFCRTYRRGQTKETTLTRLAVVDSVDTDILKMQDRKTDDINRIMGDSPRSKNLNIPDLLSLFGATGTDDNGHTFILVDDREHNRRTHRNAAWDGAEILANGSHA